MTTLLAVYDGSDNLLMRFEYADARMPVAMTGGGATYYLAYDQVGTLKAVADASGNVVRKIEYDSFGNIISDSDPAFAVPFGFAGGLHDRDTGLVRFGYRDYDPDTGRWTAKDPILFAGGDTDLYGYCVNDPVNLTDSLGLQTTTAMPGSGPFPPLHPVFIPGSPENDMFVNDVLDMIDAIVGALCNESSDDKPCEEKNKSRKDYEEEKEDGQQYEEISEAKDKVAKNRPKIEETGEKRRGEQNKIRSTKKSKQQDKCWLKQFTR